MGWKGELYVMDILFLFVDGNKVFFNKCEFDMFMVCGELILLVVFMNLLNENGIKVIVLNGV